jgi:hypothetical protein
MRRDPPNFEGIPSLKNHSDLWNACYTLLVIDPYSFENFLNCHYLIWEYTLEVRFVPTIFVASKPKGSSLTFLDLFARLLLDLLLVFVCYSLLCGFSPLGISLSTLSISFPLLGLSSGNIYGDNKEGDLKKLFTI